MALIDEIKEETKKLLDEKRVDVIIGYRQGTLPLKSTPLFISRSKDIDSLIFDPTCSNNLSSYVKKFKGKVGVIAKGCDGRSLVTLLVERQIERQNLVIIGVGCKGVIDLKKVKERLDGKEILSASILDERVTLKGEDFESILPLDDILASSCKVCQYKSPPLYDLLVGDGVVEEKSDFKEVEEFEKKGNEERWMYFEEEVSRCIRCYACRETCPSCYCEYCVVDRSEPQWFGKTTDLSDTMIFHLIKALHVAGRCVGCGACSRACPVGIELTVINRKLEKEVKENFGFMPGLSLEEMPPLASYKEEDPQEFIL